MEVKRIGSVTPDFLTAISFLPWARILHPSSRLGRVARLTRSISRPFTRAAHRMEQIQHGKVPCTIRITTRPPTHFNINRTDPRKDTQSWLKQGTQLSECHLGPLSMVQKRSAGHHFYTTLITYLGSEPPNPSHPRPNGWLGSESNWTSHKGGLTLEIT